MARKPFSLTEYVQAKSVKPWQELTEEEYAEFKRAWEARYPVIKDRRLPPIEGAPRRLLSNRTVPRNINVLVSATRGAYHYLVCSNVEETRYWYQVTKGVEEVDRAFTFSRKVAEDWAEAVRERSQIEPLF